MTTRRAEIPAAEAGGRGRSKTGEDSSPNSIEKILSVIDCIYLEELTFTEIKEKLEIPKATLHRILQSLEAFDFVKRDPSTDRYRLGMKFIYYGESLKAKLTLGGVAEPSVRELARLTGESACVSVLYNNMTFTLVAMEGDESALTSRLVPFSPLNCSASGKLFLMERSDEALKEYFSSSLCENRTANSICTVQDYQKEREKIRKSGLSFDNEEYEYGLFCVSSQLSTYTGPINASIGITGPIARIRMKGVDALSGEVKKKAAEISDILQKIKYDFEY